jgi:hypothetical protein
MLNESLLVEKITLMLDVMVNADEIAEYYLKMLFSIFETIRNFDRTSNSVTSRFLSKI